MQVWEQYLDRRAMMRDFAAMVDYMGSDAWSAAYSARLARSTSAIHNSVAWSSGPFETLNPALQIVLCAQRQRRPAALLCRPGQRHVREAWAAPCSGRPAMSLPFLVVCTSFILHAEGLLHGMLRAYHSHNTVVGMYQSCLEGFLRCRLDRCLSCLPGQDRPDPCVACEVGSDTLVGARRACLSAACTVLDQTLVLIMNNLFIPSRPTGAEYALGGRMSDGVPRRGIVIPAGGTVLLNHAYATIKVTGTALVLLF